MKPTALLRPEVEPTHRARMTPARKRRIHGLAQGRCGCGCGEPVPLSGPGVIYDHRVMVEHGGLDDWPNLRPVRTACDKPKTSEDLKRNGKTRRQRKKGNLRFERPQSKRPLRSGAKLPGKGKGPKLRGAGFRKGPKRKLQSRGFR